jgi:hypothetical protein
LKGGKIARGDLRSKLDLNTYRFAREAKVSTPLFAAFGKTLVDQIESAFNTDSIAEKLAEVRKALPDITKDEDRQTVQKLKLAIQQAAERVRDWEEKLTHPAKKITRRARTGPEQHSKGTQRCRERG